MILRFALYISFATLMIAEPKMSDAKEQNSLPLPMSDEGVIELTDLKFDKVVQGRTPWLIVIYAPWCPACIELEDDWETVAIKVASNGILVGRIDGSVHRTLLRRFKVERFPSIYYCRPNEGDICEYSGARTVGKLLLFAREGWKSVEPRTGCQSPVSRCGRLFGELGNLPVKGWSYYLRLKDYGYSDLALISALLSIPLVLGLSMLCVGDFLIQKRGRVERPHLD